LKFKIHKKAHGNFFPYALNAFTSSLIYKDDKYK